MKAKALIQSRTFWFNALFALVGIASLFGFNDFQADPEVVQGISVIVAIGNIVLRLRTSLPINRLK